ncbi:unnamed protein product [Rhizophagus irregularis]|uniref:Uncharacterized protein n=1 Tax=Rhizophagus irregularis TaxID=588596 RepID=A0A915Z2H2_9GLOM|nr:unnamed protein product [Rhizophagus irregularis]CAB5358243.1 unnamed protein product [Rhizophagus irregularis]
MSTFLKTAINPPYHEQFSYCLYHDKKGKETETLQLIVGRSTVQIWRQINDDSKNKDEHPNKGEAFLEHIWSNHIPVKQEQTQTRLRIEKFVYRPNDGSNSKIKDFYLKEEIDEIERKLKEIDNSNISEMEKEKRKQNISEKLKRREKVVQGKDIKKFQTVRHACKALVHIRKRYKSKSDAGNYKTCMIPSNKLWPGKMFLKDDDLDFDKREDELPENNMELAIYYCRGRELKDTIIVAYLLEYYSRNPTNCVGWMCTVSKAILLLFKYNYDDFVRKLLDQGHLLGQNPDENILIESYNSDTKFRALTPIVKLKSDESVKLKWYNDNWIWNNFNDLKNKLKEYRNFEKSPLALRVVPFPGFTINSIKKQKKKHTFSEILNRFFSILIPQWRQIKQNETNKLSPFSRMVLYENNDDIYDNPAIEAVIDFRWRKTKFFLYLLCLRFLIFAICFILVSSAYLNRSYIVNGNFLLVLIIIFYYLVIYQLIIEVKQFRYHGFKNILVIYLTFLI